MCGQRTEVSSVDGCATNTYRLEGSDLTFAAGDVVYHEAALCTSCVLVLEELSVRDLRYSFVRSISGLEVEVGRPVVGKILGVATCGARRLLGDICHLHCSVEGITTDNLMQMRRGSLAGIDERIDTINGELRAAEPQHGEAIVTSELGAWEGIGARGQCKDDRGNHACDLRTANA